MISSIPHLLAVAVLLYQNALPNEPALQVICEGALPFSQAELEAALRLRWRLLGRPPERPILVRDLGEGQAVIEVGPGKREIALQGQTSEAAARIVALLAVDLLAESPVGVGILTQTLPPTRGRTTLSAQLLVPFEANAWSPSLDPMLGLDVCVLGHLSVGASLGYISLAALPGTTWPTVHKSESRAMRSTARRAWLARTRVQPCARRSWPRTTGSMTSPARGCSVGWTKPSAT